jgi:hypothetical protein
LPAFRLSAPFRNFLEPLLVSDGWRHCGDGFSDVNDFMDSLRLDKFRVIADERKRITKRIKELQPAVSNRQIAKTLGVDESTVRADRAAGNPAPRRGTAAETAGSEGKAAGNPAPALTGSKAAATIDRHEKKEVAAEETRQRREASRAAEPIPDEMDLRIGDCRVVLADIADNSVPLILTDPPYGDDAEPLYHWLAQWAQRVLIPGGSLICYTGQSRLDRDVAILSERLRYWWLLIMPHDESQRLPGKFVIANFKPVLWYVKDHRRGRSLLPDVLRSPERDKAQHEWGQGDGGVGSIIEHLTEPGELILDPFAGTATWGRRAHSMGRRWIGADIAKGGTETVKAAS